MSGPHRAAVTQETVGTCGGGGGMDVAGAAGACEAGVLGRTRRSLHGGVARPWHKRPRAHGDPRGRQRGGPSSVPLASVHRRPRSCWIYVRAQCWEGKFADGRWRGSAPRPRIDIFRRRDVGPCRRRSRQGRRRRGWDAYGISGEEQFASGSVLKWPGRREFLQVGRRDVASEARGEIFGGHKGWRAHPLAPGVAS